MAVYWFMFLSIVIILLFDIDSKSSHQSYGLAGFLTDFLRVDAGWKLDEKLKQTQS